MSKCSQAKPNFLMVIPDQLRFDALGTFGSPIGKTPAVDALAASGVKFTQAYAQNSVCGPSRASFLTGLYPHTRGHRTLFHLLRADEPNLLRRLKESGYHVAHVGERGDTFADGVTELSCDEYGFKEPPEFANRLSDMSAEDPMSRLYYIGREAAGRFDPDEAAIRTAEAWLRSPPVERPWMLYLPLFEPHPPFVAAEPYFSMHDRATVPPRLPRETGAAPAYREALRRAQGVDRFSEAHWREMAATYHGMVSRFDDHLARVLAALQASGARDNTYVILFTDHGEYLGDHDLVEKWPTGLEDCLLHIPLVVSGPGIPPGGSCDALVEMVDLPATVYALAGIEAGYSHFGRSLVPLLLGTARVHRTSVFAEGGYTLDEEPLMETAPFPYELKAGLQHEQPQLVGKAVALRDDRWTYIWRLYEPAELYDRRADPGELHNLAGGSENADLERSMRDQILRWMVSTSDVLPWMRDARKPKVGLPKPAQTVQV
ncbi:MAG: sulfatase-like hydrolase/transferase [Rhodoferax sp.]